MNTKRLIITSVVIFFMYVLMDLAFYGLFEEKMAGKADRPASDQDQLLPFILAGLFLASFLFSYLFEKLSEGGDKIREGMKNGIILGTFMYLPLFLIFYATRDTRPLDAWLINAGFHIIQFGIFGIVVAHIRSGYKVFSTVRSSSRQSSSQSTPPLRLSLDAALSRFLHTHSQLPVFFQTLMFLWADAALLELSKAFSCYKFNRHLPQGSKILRIATSFTSSQLFEFPWGSLRFTKDSNNQRLSAHLSRAPIVYIMLDVANNHTVL